MCEVDWKQRVSDFKTKCAQKMETVKQRHEEERRQFEIQCQQTSFLQKFTKPSLQLLDSWRLQKKWHYSMILKALRKSNGMWMNYKEWKQKRPRNEQ
jgi:hypothetical protein